MRGATRLDYDFVLRGTRIGDQLSLERITVNGDLNMNAGSVGGSLLMANATIRQNVNFRFLGVGRNLDSRAARLRRLDLTGAHIGGTLRLGDEQLPMVHWEEKGELILQNASAGILRDRNDSWPEDVRLDGFVYGRLDRLGDMVQEGGDWFKKWLERDRLYSTQSYRQLASVLRDAGYEEMADDILFANRERERSEADVLGWRWWRLLALKCLIGYGYGWKTFRVLFWVVAFVGFGVYILRRTGETNKGFWYSLDMILPGIRLSEDHYNSRLGNPRAQYYFFFHQLVGYVLIVFVIAALSGLTE